MGDESGIEELDDDGNPLEGGSDLPPLTDKDGTKDNADPTMADAEAAIDRMTKVDLIGFLEQEGIDVEEGESVDKMKVRLIVGFPSIYLRSLFGYTHFVIRWLHLLVSKKQNRSE
jgi:hypothetical protein